MVITGPRRSRCRISGDGSRHYRRNADHCLDVVLLSRFFYFTCTPSSFFTRRDRRLWKTGCARSYSFHPKVCYLRRPGDKLLGLQIYWCPRSIKNLTLFEEMSKAVGFMGNALRYSHDQEETLDVHCIMPPRFGRNSLDRTLSLFGSSSMCRGVYFLGILAIRS